MYAALELAGEVKLLQREEPKMGKKTVGEGKWREVGGGWKGWTFELPKGGKVHQFWNEEEEELTRVDELLEEYQGVETGGLFKRSRMGVHRCELAIIFAFSSSSSCYVMVGRSWRWRTS